MRSVCACAWVLGGGEGLEEKGRGGKKKDGKRVGLGMVKGEDTDELHWSGGGGGGC